MKSTRLLLLCIPLLMGADWFVSADAGSGNGTESSPWTIQTAFSSTNVKPGDTVYLAEGHYYVGALTSTLRGTPEARIIVKPKSGRVIIDTNVKPPGLDVGAISLKGGYTIYTGFEIICSSKRSRTTNVAGSFPWDSGGDVYRGDVNKQGPGIDLIGNFIHDLNNGIATQHTAEGGVDEDNVIANCGWHSTADRGHGHAVYGQNTGNSIKTVAGNICFGHFAEAIHFTGTEKAPLINIHSINNISIHSGTRNSLYGGSSVSKGWRIEGNVNWRNDLQDTFDLGYIGSPTEDGDAIVRNNVQVGAFRMLRPFRSLLFTNNTVMNGRNNAVFELRRTAASTFTITNNAYHSTLPTPFSDNGAFKTFTQWQQSGYDAGSTFSQSMPNLIVIHPSRINSSRANVAVFNWSRSTTAQVALTPFLSNGEAYEIRSAYDPLGATVASGTYAGPVSLPMTTPMLNPIGMNEPSTAPSDPRFQVFIVRKTAEAPLPPPVEPPPIDPPPAPITAYRQVLLGPDGRLYVKEGEVYKEIKLQ